MISLHSLTSCHVTTLLFTDLRHQFFTLLPKDSYVIYGRSISHPITELSLVEIKPTWFHQLVSELYKEVQMTYVLHKEKTD